MESIYVKIRYKDMEIELEGSMEEVYQEIRKWFMRYLPSIEIAEKLLLDIDFHKLAKQLSNYVYITNEGDVILRDSSNELSLHNKILIVLSSLRLLEYLGKRPSSHITLDDLSKIVVSTTKTISSRLSELRSMGYVERNRENKNVVYKITLRGLLYLQNKLS